MREKLIKLLEDAKQENINLLNFESKIIADYLISKGVVALPCKVGDVVWRVSTNYHTKTDYVEKTKVYKVSICEDEIKVFCNCSGYRKNILGKTVFLTKEEAEKALERRKAE